MFAKKVFKLIDHIRDRTLVSKFATAKVACFLFWYVSTKYCKSISFKSLDFTGSNKKNQCKMLRNSNKRTQKLVNETLKITTNFNTYAILLVVLFIMMEFSSVVEIVATFNMYKYALSNFVNF